MWLIVINHLTALKIKCFISFIVIVHLLVLVYYILIIFVNFLFPVIIYFISILFKVFKTIFYGFGKQ